MTKLKPMIRTNLVIIALNTHNLKRNGAPLPARQLPGLGRGQRAVLRHQPVGARGGLLQPLRPGSGLSTPSPSDRGRAWQSPGPPLGHNLRAHRMPDLEVRKLYPGNDAHSGREHLESPGLTVQDRLRNPPTLQGQPRGPVGTLITIPIPLQKAPGQENRQRLVGRNPPHVRYPLPQKPGP